MTNVSRQRPEPAVGSKTFVGYRNISPKVAQDSISATKVPLPFGTGVSSHFRRHPEKNSLNRDFRLTLIADVIDLDLVFSRPDPVGAFFFAVYRERFARRA